MPGIESQASGESVSEPYAPPVADEASVPQADGQRFRPLKWLCISLSLFGISYMAVAFGPDSLSFRRVVGLPGFAASTIFALLAMASGVATALRLPGTQGVLLNLVVSLVGLIMSGIGALSALLSTVGFSRGRQLRRFGRVLLPPVLPGSSWLGPRLALAGALDAPAGLAAQWRENGRTEHASVAAFARLTLDLMALGAPPALIAAANSDALDEIRHTEACFGLARAIDGRCECPGPFPAAQHARTLPRVRSLALAQLAVLSLIDGALHEGVSARIIAKLARRSGHPVITQVLKQIAADEGRHAAHGWDVVEWCLEQGGWAVAHALEGAAHALPKRMHSALPEAAASGGWEAWGIHGHALESEEYEAALGDVRRRVRQLVATQQKAHASAA